MLVFPLPSSRFCLSTRPLTSDACSTTLSASHSNSPSPRLSLFTSAGPSQNDSFFSPDLISTRIPSSAVACLSSFSVNARLGVLERKAHVMSALMDCASLPSPPQRNESYDFPFLQRSSPSGR